MTTSDDDFELLRRWKGGDRDAGGKLIERHFKRIHRFFARKIGDADLVQELVQRTFDRCNHRVHAFEGRSSFSSFLFGIARYILLEHFREAQRDGRSVSLDVEATPLVDLDPNPFMVLEARADRKLIIHALRRLPLDVQILVELYFFERLPAVQVGDILGVPESTVRARIRSSRQRVREVVEQLATSPEVLESTLMTLDGWAADVKERTRSEEARSTSPDTRALEEA